MSLYLGENLISGVATPVEPTRNIGQIVTSTIPLTDAGLHLLDGSLISGSGSYADFVDYIKNLHQQDPNGSWITDETGWQNSVNTYGVCGKFAIDYPNNTVRLPKITGFIEGTTDLTALDDLVEAGLPNITGSFEANSRDTSNCTSAFNKGSSRYNISSGANIAGCWNISFDASQSNSIYGNSTTVQPQAIKVLYYIVIATSTKTDIEVDIDEIATDLNGKADTDLSNAVIASSFSGTLNTAGIRTVVETYVNGTSGYRLWSDGYCEQWGQVSTGANTTSTINLVKTFNNTDYNVTATNLSYWDTGAWSVTPVCMKDSGSSFRVGNVADTTVNFSWYACGYVS